MRIAVVGTIWLNTPPKNYGGTEEVVYNLVNGLNDKGHDVTFFGPATSLVKSKIIPTTPSPLRSMGIGWENFTATLLHMTAVFDQAQDFDIIHVHLNKSQDLISLPFSVYKNVPTLFTMHYPFPNRERRPHTRTIVEKYRFLPYSSISNSQQKGPLNYIATVYNGINTAQYPFEKNPDDYFAWLGKINPVKGTKEAILAVKKANSRLILMGAVEKGVAQSYTYFKKEIEPLIDNKQIIFYENVGLPEKAQLLGKAKALLNPIRWPEPFGLVMIESQATGTPVIAFPKGAAPEIIQDNKTGFLVSSLPEMVDKMQQVDSLNRTDCRQFVEENFSVDTMVTGYEEVYETIIKHWPEYYKKQMENLESEKIEIRS